MCWLFEQCLLFSTNKCAGFFLPPRFFWPHHILWEPKKNTTADSWPQPRNVNSSAMSSLSSKSSTLAEWDGANPKISNYGPIPREDPLKDSCELICFKLYLYMGHPLGTHCGWFWSSWMASPCSDGVWLIYGLGLIKRVLNNAEVNEMTGKGIRRQRYQQSIFIPPGCLVTRNTSPVTLLSLNFSHFLIVCLANTPSCHFSSLQKYRSIMIALRCGGSRGAFCLRWFSDTSAQRKRVKR